MLLCVIDVIDDTAFKFLAMHFGIAWGDKTKGKLSLQRN